MLQLWNYIVVDLVELISWVLRKYMYCKKKLKMLGCVRNIHYNIPQRTHGSNGCPHSLCSMVFIYNDNLETKYFYL